MFHLSYLIYGHGVFHDILWYIFFNDHGTCSDIPSLFCFWYSNLGNFSFWSILLIFSKNQILVLFIFYFQFIYFIIHFHLLSLNLICFSFCSSFRWPLRLQSLYAFNAINFLLAVLSLHPTNFEKFYFHLVHITFKLLLRVLLWYIAYLGECIV